MEFFGFATDGVGQCDCFESTSVADYYAKSYMGRNIMHGGNGKW